jgi:ADP-ribose pyrophosphatase YjhB (NUDIX family)
VLKYRRGVVFVGWSLFWGVFVVGNFVYCSRCGVGGVVDSGRKVVCGGCGFEFYFNVAAAVAGLIFVEGKLLLTRRAYEPCKGMLDLPGGFVDRGETGEAALAREIREELNLDIEDVEYYGTAANTYLYGQLEYQVLDLFYLCRPRDMSCCVAADDVADFGLFELGEIDLAELAFSSTRKMLGRLRGERSGL